MKHIALILFLASALSAQVFSPPGKVRRYSGTPTSGDCTASNLNQMASDITAIPTAYYACRQTSSGVYAWVGFTFGGGAGTGDVSGASNLTTAGAIPYVASSGTLAQDTPALHWDATNNRLGLGTATPSTTLHVVGTITVSTDVNVSGTTGGGSAVYAQASGFLGWAGRSRLYSPSDGTISLYNSGATDFTCLQLGGTSTSFPGLCRSGATVKVRLADNSAAAVLNAAAGTSSGDVVTIDGTQTLTNKSISASQINSGTIATARLGSGSASGSTCLLGDQTWGACGGATSASSLTDLKLTKTSSTVATIAAGTYAKGNAPRITFAGATFTIGSLSISGATNASPIVLTVSSTTSTSLRNGDTVMVSGVGGNTAANGTWVVEVPTSTTIRLIGSTGNGSYTSGGTVAGSGNGTCEFYLTPQGYATADCSSSAGLILTCTGSCVMNQSTTPTPPSDATLSGSMTVATGAWGAATENVAAINSGHDVQAGQGIAVATAAGTQTVSVDSTVMRNSGTNTVTGTINATAATRTAPHRSGSGTPTGQNCTIGDTYFQTDASAGSNTWACTTTGTPGTWTLQGGGSGVNNTFTANGGTWTPFGTFFCSSCGNYTPTITSGQVVCMETLGPAPGGTPAKIAFYTSSNSFNIGWALYSADGNTLIAESTESAGASTAMVSQAFTPVLEAGKAYRLCYSGDGNIGVLTVDSSGSNMSQFFNTGVTSPKMGRAANTATWSAGSVTWPSTLGSFTSVNLGIPMVVITKN